MKKYEYKKQTKKNNNEDNESNAFISCDIVFKNWYDFDNGFDKKIGKEGKKEARKAEYEFLEDGLI